jgi:hypothetical protein
MSAISLKDRQKINHELKRVGFGGLDDPNTIAQIATLYRTHDSFRGLLLSTAPDQRTIAYNALRPHLCFTPKPLDVYEREIHEKAEREQWDVIHQDNPHFPQPFKVSEIETDEYKLQKLASEAIEQAAHEKDKGALHLTCTKCTVGGEFPAPTRKQATKAAHGAGWRWDERNGTKRTYCPAHVPGRATMTVECFVCEKKEKLRVWDEQDGYAMARRLGWEIGDVTKCPKCAVKLVVVQ